MDTETIELFETARHVLRELLLCAELAERPREPLRECAEEVIAAIDHKLRHPHRPGHYPRPVVVTARVTR
jgi:hypothetical protein